jgi:hypothetical protein
MQAGLLERTGDSGAWPCNVADARFVKLEVPTKLPRAGSFQATAILAPHEIQNVADSIDDLLQASVGYRLTFTQSIDLASDGKIPEETVARLNELLKEVSPALRLVPKH